jgi:hypothetical protein
VVCLFFVILNKIIKLAEHSADDGSTGFEVIERNILC